MSDALARLREILAEFPAGMAYPMSELVYDPSGHDFDWTAIEASAGIGLPADYKRLADGFGDPVFSGLFLVPPDGFRAKHDLHAGYLRDWFARYPENVRPIHPDPGGLLLCAFTEGRDVLWWDTTDPDPDRWTIVWDVEFRGHTYAGTVTELLVEEFTGTLHSRLTGVTLGDPDPDLDDEDED
ncbi:SMI1/KNR4 family protein [Lentzea sp. NPDC051838]|uniref:SMI1/KNR4 family protein n=1 Tax=Lentzea sp. NPDC051838 TaxID=3154849 RepID=UPI003415C1B6